MLGEGQRAPGVDPTHTRLRAVDGERGEISHLVRVRVEVRGRARGRGRVRAR